MRWQSVTRCYTPADAFARAEPRSVRRDASRTRRLDSTLTSLTWDGYSSFEGSCGLDIRIRNEILTQEQSGTLSRSTRGAVGAVWLLVKIHFQHLPAFRYVRIMLSSRRSMMSSKSQSAEVWMAFGVKTRWWALTNLPSSIRKGIETYWNILICLGPGCGHQCHSLTWPHNLRSSAARKQQESDSQSQSTFNR